MSHTLTEADTFTASVVVPDGIDSRSDAAGDVERIAQALANRTKNLNLHAAKTNTPNTFAGNQTINGALTVNGSATVSGNITTANGTVTASDVHATDDVTCDDQLTTVRLKVTGSGVGAIFDHDVSVQGALAVTGDVNMAGALGVGTTITAAGTITSAQTIHGRDLKADDDVRATNEFQYVLPWSRVTAIPLSDVQLYLYDSETGNVAAERLPRRKNSRGPIYLTIDSAAMIPVRMPAGAVLHTVEVMYEKADAASVRFLAGTRRSAASDWVASPPVRPTDVSTWSGFLNGAAGVYVQSVDFDAGAAGSGSTVSPDTTYEIEISSCGAGDIIQAIRVLWTDPGPRNY